MKKIHKNIINNNWFSLVFAMWIVLIITLIAFSILEYMIPFSKNIKWIENSTVSYYNSNWWIEESLWIINKNIVGHERLIDFQANTPIWTKIEIDAKWNLLPLPWFWNSDYDNNWNKIFMWWPIQLEIWNDVTNLENTDWSNINLFFRIPNMDWNSNLFLFWDTLPIINWQLSAQDDTLNSDNSYIVANDICSSLLNPCNSLNLNTRNGKNLDWITKTFSTFYDEKCESSNSCVLKLSIINSLKINNLNKIPLPYLEWKIDTISSNKEIPLRYSVIKASWKSYGFRKDLEIRIAQQTISEAFDFTVFQ